MVLHFNVIEIFCYAMFLAVCQMFTPYTLLVAFSGMIVFLSIFSKKGIKNCLPDFIFAVAMLMNVWYVLESWGNIRQHDYYNFVMHADYFVKNNFFWDNPLGYLQSVYFQPPLWGGIAGVFMKFLLFDSVRFLSLFCIGGCGIIFWRIMELLCFNEKVRLGVFSFFLFFPIHSIFANLVNNDALVYFLMIAMIYYTMLWYHNHGWKNAFILSGLLFISGMVKFSGLMIMPAMGGLFVCDLLKAKDKFSKTLWGQFGLIGMGAIVGFSWGLFLLYFNLPLVPPPQDVDVQLMTQYSLWERFTLIKNVGVLFIDIPMGQVEPNVLLSLIKTALFGEWAWYLSIWAYILYILGGTLGVILTISFVSLWQYRLGKDYSFNLFCVLLVFSVLIAWIYFWLSYPYFCSTEFRYIVILFPVSLLWFGNYLTQKSLPKYVYYILTGGLVLFVIAKFMLYLYTI